MSLKAAHVLFVVTATILSFAGAYWSWEAYEAGGGEELLFVAVVSLFVALVLPVYGVWFYRKLCRRSSP